LFGSIAAQCAKEETSSHPTAGAYKRQNRRVRRLVGSDPSSPACKPLYIKGLCKSALFFWQHLHSDIAVALLLS
jgi:hypothetical protein